jgi:hypothetical protein
VPGTKFPLALILVVHWQKEARSILLQAETEAVRIIQRTTGLLEGVKWQKII